MTKLLLPDDAVSCKREPISKRLRFEIFKRDAFTCQYCGSLPPKVVLEVDHIEPVSAGGKSVEHNLITACYDCNRGKGAVRLSAVPETLADRAARVRDSEEQIAAYREVLEARIERREADVWRLIEIALGVEETSMARFMAFEKFIDRLPFETLMEAAKLTAARMSRYGQTRRTRYFCAVCWNALKANKA